LAQHVGSAEAVASTLLGTNETANKTAENTVANILETPGLMAQPTSTCTDWETDTSSFLDWVWLRKIEAESTAKSEDERSNPPESLGGQSNPAGRERPSQ
jgi:hypothetical protein